MHNTPQPVCQALADEGASHLDYLVLRVPQRIVAMVHYGLRLGAGVCGSRPRDVGQRRQPVLKVPLLARSLARGRLRKRVASVAASGRGLPVTSVPHRVDALRQLRKRR